MALIKPAKRPHDFGFKKKDSHLIVNDESETVKAFSFEGELLWSLPALARGQYGETEYRRQNSDTPPGLYKIGDIHRDLENEHAIPIEVKMPYGWYTFDLIDLEGQEENIGRSGICLHGGGSANGWPGAWQSLQTLYPTHGCVRMHNLHLQKYVLPLAEQGIVFISVFQEA